MIGVRTPRCYHASDDESGGFMISSRKLVSGAQSSGRAENCHRAFSAIAASVSLFLFGALSASADTSLTPIGLNANQLIAQTAPPQFIPTDTTPFTISPERNV